jgi:hypothetical protein
MYKMRLRQPQRTNLPLLLSLLLLCCLDNQHSLCLAEKEDKKISVFIMAGDDNIEGFAHIDHLYKVITEYNKEDPYQLHPKYEHLIAPLTTPVNSKLGGPPSRRHWAVHPHVYVSYDRERNSPLVHGPLSVDGGFGARPTETFGPEIEFGWVLGDAFNPPAASSETKSTRKKTETVSPHPILICKTGWSGQSLVKDFRSPSSLPLSIHAKLHGAIVNINATSNTGFYWYRILSNVRRTLDNIGTILGPEYKHYVPHIEGFIWWHGYTDIFEGVAEDDYQLLLINLLRDIRSEYGVGSMQNIPILVAELGGSGTHASSREVRFRRMQHQVTQMPEFNLTSRFVKTSHFLQEEVHTEPYLDINTHYFGRGDTMIDIGGAMAREYLDLVNSYTAPYSSLGQPRGNANNLLDGSSTGGAVLFWLTALLLGSFVSMRVYKGHWNRQCVRRQCVMTTAALRVKLNRPRDRPSTPPLTPASPRSHPTTIELT